MYKQSSIFSKALILVIIICIIFLSSSTYAISIGKDNLPPLTPDPPTAKFNKTRKIYIFSAVTTDPNNDEISYLFDWGDGTTSGWTDWFPSGENATATHSFNKGTYLVKVMARDVYFAESNWSEPVEVEISIEKSESPTSIDYEVIFTYIRGNGYLNWSYNWGKYRGEASLIKGVFWLYGFRWENGTIEYFKEKATYVYAYRFLGYEQDYRYFLIPPFIHGFARGDIVWY